MFSLSSSRYGLYFFFNMGLICGPLVGREGLGGCEKVGPADCGCYESRLGCLEKVKGSPAVGEDGHRRA